VQRRRLDPPAGPLLAEDDGTLLHVRGIRYARAVRFAAPQPIAPWLDVLDTTRRGPVCPQLPSRLEWVTGPVVDGLAMSEDCQVLSVTAPSDADGLPVMVWLHGGAYVSGGGEAPKYDADELARRGRVVVVSDPDLFRNDVIRRCSWATDVRAVRMLEWLRDGGDAPRTVLVFDEYHQGFGHRASLFGTIGDFLGQHPLGRTLVQLALAALVLLLAVGPRPIPPVDVLRVERRDPLEQIDALAHAYEQVHATRTLTARLLRGVRSRVERAWSDTRARPNEEFLADAEARAPTLRPDVELVRRALAETLPDRTVPELGAALRRIEQTLTTTPTA